MIAGGQYLELLSKTRTNQANYQRIVNCFLLQSPKFEASQEEIAKELLSQNSGKTLKFFNSSECPVWKIMSGKSMLVKNGQNWRLNTKLSEAQLKEAKRICEEEL